MPASSPSSIAPARSPRFTFPPSRKKPPGISCAVAKTSAPISCAPAIGSRNSSSATAAASPRRRKPGRNAMPPGSRRNAGHCRRSSKPTAPMSAPSMKPSAASRPSTPSCATCSRSSRYAPASNACAASAASTTSPRSPSPPNSATLAAFHPPRASWPSSASCPPNTPAAPNRPAGAITKTGNAHLRRVLVESAWHYRHHPFPGRSLTAPPARRAPRGHPARVDAQHRLHRRYRRLAARGKPKQHIVTAVARELTGFLWAALTQ